jgi:heterodisulfide reductase subunit B
MPESKMLDVTYFPGCSLATTAKENNASLIAFCRGLGINLAELEDWNCCGSSSVHSIDKESALMLASRNLALAPEGRPLLVACPSCMLRLRTAQLHLAADPEARKAYEKQWGRPFDPDLEILHFFEMLTRREPLLNSKNGEKPLEGVRFAAYYGCMLARPPSMRNDKNHYGLMERVLAGLGAASVPWSFSSRCCGTFLTAARPEVVIPLVNQIVNGARAAGANCIVTACAMCHLNLESRCTSHHPVPILHLSELLALAMGFDNGEIERWFSRHLIDPRPLLKEMRLLNDARGHRGGGR